VHERVVNNVTDVIEKDPGLQIVPMRVQSLSENELKENGTSGTTNVAHGNVVDAVVAVARSVCGNAIGKDVGVVRGLESAFGSDRIRFRQYYR
jgi:hypothetical protein